MDKRNFVVYVAGPYSGVTRRQTRDNISHAIEVGEAIRVLGFSAIVPHIESHGCENCLSEKGWYDHGIALMSRCDVVFDFRYGRRSNGTEKEVKIAEKLGIPIVINLIELNRLYEELRDGRN